MKTSSCGGRRWTFSDHETADVDEALRILSRAYGRAQDVNCDIWEFAVELTEFHAASVPTDALRWLMHKGYVEHAHELGRSRNNKRPFRPTCCLTFSEHSCFVLTESGLERAKALPWRAKGYKGPQSNREQSRSNSRMASASKTPFWDAINRTLFWGDTVVKVFRHSAPNQELVLTSFQELNWSHRIDDPLPKRPGQDPKQRLHDTIKKLNQNQVRSLIHFYGDGSGLGICWRLSK